MFPEIAVMDGKMQPPSGAGGRKRGNLTLDLNTASPKKTRIQNILTSPDVQKLNMSSPDIEKLLSQNPSLATPTPSGYGFPKVRIIIVITCLLELKVSKRLGTG